MELYGQILKTNNYEMFKTLKGNRVISKPNFAKLANSMKEKQLVTPILVNEKYEIIDGQHRFKACKEFGLPVYFYVVNGYGVDEVKRCNTTGSNWNKQSFLQSYVDQELESYIRFKEIKDRYDLSISSILKIMSLIQGVQLTHMSRVFEDGGMVIENEVKLIDFLEKLEDFKFFNHYKSNSFISAFLKLSNYDRYDHRRMLSKLANNKENLKKSISQDEYLSLLCNKIYSFGPTKDPIYYNADSKRFHQ